MKANYMKAMMSKKPGKMKKVKKMKMQPFSKIQSGQGPYKAGSKKKKMKIASY